MFVHFYTDTLVQYNSAILNLPSFPFSSLPFILLVNCSLILFNSIGKLVLWWEPTALQLSIRQILFLLVFSHSRTLFFPLRRSKNHMHLTWHVTSTRRLCSFWVFLYSDVLFQCQNSFSQPMNARKTSQVTLSFAIRFDFNCSSAFNLSISTL